MVAKYSQKILEKVNLRNTPIRKAVYNLFAESGFALSHADIENKLGDRWNRVTIYRTLNTFLETNLVHKVVDDNGVSKFLLNASHVDCDHESHEHLHFKCKNCGHLYCLDILENPKLDLPEGFELTDLTVHAEGLCANCQTIGS